MAVFIWDDHSSRDFTEAWKCSGIQGQEICSQEELAEALSPEGLLIMNQSLEARRTAVRMLITARMPFALYGLPGPDEEARMQLARRLKKRHVPACWLGSLRFLPGAFRLKELVNSGVFGQIRSVEMLGRAEEEGTFDFYRRGDLLSWMIPQAENTPEILWKEAAENEYGLRLQGTAGTAEWHCTRNGGAELHWQMGERKKSLNCPYENPMIQELRLLNVTVQNHWVWNGLAVIRPL